MRNFLALILVSSVYNYTCFAAYTGPIDCAEPELMDCGEVPIPVSKPIPEPVTPPKILQKMSLETFSQRMINVCLELAGSNSVPKHPKHT